MATAKASIFVSFLLLLYLPIPSFSVLEESIAAASETLWSSNYLSAALTLNLLSRTLTASSQSLTVFSPSDSAFVLSGSPSLSLLRFHISPLYLTIHNIINHTEIPTLLPNHSLTVTSPPSRKDSCILINGIGIDGSPLYDDGALMILGIEEFFDMGFPVRVSDASVGSPDPMYPYGYTVDDASRVLRSKGYGSAASFLDLQLLGTKDFTLFAPDDSLVVSRSLGNFSRYMDKFLKQAVPRKISWSDLVNFENETILATFKDGLKVNITRYGDTISVNGVPIRVPDMVYSDRFFVHGLGEAFNQSDAESSDYDKDFFAAM